MTAGLLRLVWHAGWPVRQALLLPVRLYRVTAGRLVGGHCRFYPSCSTYAMLAIGRAGAIRGLGLTAWRVARCSPLCAGGVDHPPVGRTWRSLHGPQSDRSAGIPVGWSDTVVDRSAIGVPA